MNRDLDIKIAEKIFNLDVQKNTWGKNSEYHSYTIGEPDYFFGDECPEGSLTNAVSRYSSDITKSWEIVEHLFRDGWKIDIEGSELLGKDMGGWDVKFSCKAGARGRFSASADSLPEAICLAALKIKNSGY